MAPGGVIYCIPFTASQVLVIDPFREFTNDTTDEYGSVSREARTPLRTE